MDKKEQTKNGGRSYGEGFPLGSRRKINGNVVLAPAHFRKMGRKLMNEVSDEEIGHFYFGYDKEQTQENIKKINQFKTA